MMAIELEVVDVEGGVGQNFFSKLSFLYERFC